ELAEPALRARYTRALDLAFQTYADWIETMRAYWSRRLPASPGGRDGADRATIRAKALDSLRGLLPAATRSNVGMFGTGQAYEALLLRMFAHPLQEVRMHADAMLVELRQIIPAFLTRIDQPNRGGRWIAY